MEEATELTERLLDGRLEARHRRSPFRLVPFLRTDFWPVASAALAVAVGALWLGRPAERRRRKPRGRGARSIDPHSPSEGSLRSNE
jgi:hypothetical protein